MSCESTITGSPAPNHDDFEDKDNEILY